MNNSTHTEIGAAIRALDKTRREEIRRCMEEFDKQYHARKAELRAACEAIGHNFRFAHLGPLGDPWFYCSVCGKSKVEITDREE